MEQVTINGLYYDQTSVRIKLGNTRLAEFLKDISFSDNVQFTTIRGGHPVPLGRGLGQYQAEAQITVLQEAWESEIQPAIAAIGNGSLAIVTFPITVNFASASGGRINTIEMPECAIAARRFPTKNGGDGFVREIPLWVREIVENGVRLVPLRLP